MRSVDVGIVVATRNRAGYLVDCLESLAIQETRASYEVVVVDNGSEDATEGLLHRWCREHTNFRALREEGGFGKSKALNAGCRSTSASLVLITDDDALADSHWVEAYRRFFEAHRGRLLMAGGVIRPVHPDLRPWPTWLSEASVPLLGELDYEAERPLKQFEHVWGPNLGFPAEVYRDLGFWDESATATGGNPQGRFEDIDYQDRMRAAGGEIWFCPDALVYHRVKADISPRMVLRRAFIKGANERYRESLNEGTGEQTST
jgi:GT2 family glycosyltransferase